MSTVRDLVNYFEDIEQIMDPKKGKLKRNSKSLRDKNSSVVKRLVNDITEVKRPASKRKNYEGKISESQTLPRNFKNPNNATTVKDEVSTIRTSRKSCTKNIETLNSPTEASFKSFIKSETSKNITVEQKLQKIQTETESIIKKVEDFGDKLRQMRINSEQKIVDIAVSSPNENIDDSSDTSENLSDSDGEDSEDMFGFNTFEDDTNNYIVETYNENGKELIITTLEITRQYINQNEVDENIEEMKKNSDYVVHDNKCVHSKSDSEGGIYVADDDVTLEHRSLIYNSFLDSMPATESQENAESDVLYYQDEFPSYRYSPVEETTPIDLYLQNTSNNYCTRDNVITVQEEEILNKNRSDSKKKEKLHFMIEELRKTEEFYILGLEKVVTRYMPYVFTQAPQDLIGRTTYIFGNIEEIYRNAQSFLKLLKACGENPEKIGQTFIDCAAEFELYPLYSKNKPTADLYLKQFDAVIRERQKQLNDKLGLASYLLTPIQRLGKYVLLLEGIQKELKKYYNDDENNTTQNKAMENIASAISVVRNVMRKGNDYIAIDSIKKSDIDLTNEGSFIMRSPFSVLKPRKFDAMVFLFENIVVFTEKSAKNLEYFKYIDSIPMSDLTLVKVEDKPNLFHLSSYSKMKRFGADAVYVLEAEAAKIKDEWTETIGKILWNQLEKVKEEIKTLNFKDDKHAAKVIVKNLNRNSSYERKKKTYRNKKTKSKFYDDNNEL